MESIDTKAQDAPGSPRGSTIRAYIQRFRKAAPSRPEERGEKEQFWWFKQGDKQPEDGSGEQDQRPEIAIDDNDDDRIESSSSSSRTPVSSSTTNEPPTPRPRSSRLVTPWTTDHEDEIPRTPPRASSVPSFEFPTMASTRSKVEPSSEPISRFQTTSGNFGKPSDHAAPSIPSHLPVPSKSHWDRDTSLYEQPFVIAHEDPELTIQRLRTRLGTHSLPGNQPNFHSFPVSPAVPTASGSNFRYSRGSSGPWSLASMEEFTSFQGSSFAPAQLPSPTVGPYTAAPPPPQYHRPYQTSQTPTAVPASHPSFEQVPTSISSHRSSPAPAPPSTPQQSCGSVAMSGSTTTVVETAASGNHTIAPPDPLSSSSTASQPQEPSLLVSAPSVTSTSDQQQEGVMPSLIQAAQRHNTTSTQPGVPAGTSTAGPTTNSAATPSPEAVAPSPSVSLSSSSLQGIGFRRMLASHVDNLVSDALLRDSTDSASVDSDHSSDTITHPPNPERDERQHDPRVGASRGVLDQERKAADRVSSAGGPSEAPAPLRSSMEAGVQVSGLETTVQIRSSKEFGVQVDSPLPWEIVPPNPASESPRRSRKGGHLVDAEVQTLCDAQTQTDPEISSTQQLAPKEHDTTLASLHSMNSPTDIVHSGCLGSHLEAQGRSSRSVSPIISDEGKGADLAAPMLRSVEPQEPSHHHFPIRESIDSFTMPAAEEGATSRGTESLTSTLHTRSIISDTLHARIQPPKIPQDLGPLMKTSKQESTAIDHSHSQGQKQASRLPEVNLAHIRRHFAALLTSVGEGYSASL